LSFIRKPNSKVAEVGLADNGKTGGMRYYLSVLIMNLTAYPMMVLLTGFGILLFPFGFFAWKIVTRWETSLIVRHFIWIYGRAWLVIMSPFVRFSRTCFKKSEVNAPCILVVNHLSFFDTFCMALLPIFDVTFTVRSWPFKMPWFYPFMRMSGYIDAESSEWDPLVAIARKRFSKGSCVLFFPEGHRSRNGDLQRFYSGAFRLAIETGVPVLPLCITGTYSLWPHGRWWLAPARIHLTMLPHVDSSLFKGPRAHIEMRKHVKALIADRLSELA